MEDRFDRIPPKDDYFEEWNRNAAQPLKKDAYSAGQLVGILFLIAIIERDNGIDKRFMEKLKMRSAEGASQFLNKAPEDVLLMVDDLIGDQE